MFTKIYSGKIRICISRLVPNRNRQKRYLLIKRVVTGTEIIKEMKQNVL